MSGVPMKSQIIRELGQADILLPALVSEALAANNRIKVRLSVLQAAARHAQQPTQPATDLENEYRAARMAHGALTSLIGGAQLVGQGRLSAPNLAGLMEDIHDDAVVMIRAVGAGKAAEGEAAKTRLAAIEAAGLLKPAGEIELTHISQLTRAAEGGNDTLHRLVMDLHKALNRLSAECAEEVVAGAHAFGLQQDDRSAVESFMGGLNQTRELKFNHPGLDTTATRSGGRLLIQNDIGTTDAHVVVVAVENNAVTITYTDVHRARAEFFVDLFDGFQAVWSGLDRHAATGLGEDNAFFLVTGRYWGDSAEARNEFLAEVGASLVFLIDWNKARKLLRGYVGGEEAVRLLDWAARHRVGHRAFLELGGNELLAAAVRNAAPTRIGFGERLDEALGRKAATDFLKSALRSSTEALQSGASVRLARDRIEAELVRHLERVDGALLATILRQLGLAHDLAVAISRHLAALRAGRSANAKQLAARASRIEQKADRIAIEARNEINRLNARPIIAELIDRAEQTVDELEQAAFIASIAPDGIDPAPLSALAELSATAIAATEAAASGLAAAVEVPEGRRTDSEDALAAVGRLIDAEHAADAQELRSRRRCLWAGSTSRPRSPCLNLPVPSSARLTGSPASGTCCDGTSWPTSRPRKEAAHEHRPYRRPVNRTAVGGSHRR
jgi:uncharacterized protein Yka (UPF0111/DUF47 family)